MTQERREIRGKIFSEEQKQILDYIGRMLEVKVELKEAKHEYLIEGRTGTILINNKQAGYIGEVHPETLQTWNIKMPISILEISLDEIFKKF